MKLLLIDGNAIMHRAFHALPPLHTSKGIPTNVIYGFFGMLHGVISLSKPNYVSVAFDTPKPTFRAEMFAEYQMHRPSMPDEFKEQIPYIQNLLDSAGISRFQKDGYEADDVIGTISLFAEKNDLETLILTGDKDIFQLVTDKTNIISPKIGISQTIIYDENKVFEKMGVKPKQIPDYKALAGDPSDNYKGVKGVGPKTAAQIINDYNSVENLFEKIATFDNLRIKNLLLENKENIFLTKKLATIVRDVDIEYKINNLRFEGYNPNMRTELENLQFWNILKRYFPENKIETKKNPTPAKTNSQPSLF